MAYNIKLPKGRTVLLNECWISPIAAYPTDWNTTRASVKVKWNFTFRFYDPAFKDDPKTRGVKQVRVQGMNRYSSLQERQEAMAALLENELAEYIEKGYNPFTKSYMKPEPEVEYEISPDLPFILALQAALDKMSVKCKPDLKSVLKGASKAIMHLHYSHFAIKDVRRRHILSVINQVQQDKGDKWSDNQFNYYRAHLRMLFETLVTWETIEVNPVDNIPKKQVIKKKRQIYTTEEHELIDRHLHEHHHPLWLLSRAFYYAGCRFTEILRLRYNDVDLKEQKFQTIRLKGRNRAVVDYTITDEALQYWKEIKHQCAVYLIENGIDSNPYLFSKGLLPGAKPITSDWLSHLWHDLVKVPLGVTADFYSLKHKRSTKLAAIAGTKVAAAANNESERMIKAHYDVEGDERAHKLIKGLVVGL